MKNQQRKSGLNNKNFREHTIDDVKFFSQQLGFEFLDDKYEGVNHRHYFKCKIHNKVYKLSYKHIVKGLGLKCCKGVKEAEKAAIKEDYVIEKLLKNEIRLIDDFTDIKKKHLVRCLKHDKSYVSTLAILLGGNKLKCCIENQEVKKKSVIIAVRKDLTWALGIRWLYNNACYSCGKKNLFYKDYKVIGWPTLKEDGIDGVCFCKECSTTFHKRHGFKDNTRDQIEQFCEEAGNKRFQPCDLPRIMFMNKFKRYIADKSKEEIEKINEDLDLISEFQLFKR